MCGIFFGISDYTEESVNFLKLIYQRCNPYIDKRGPNADCDPHNLQVNKWNLLFGASVLWLQGIETTKQPIETNKYWFLYNGDVYGDSLIPLSVRALAGDTVPLIEAVEASGNIKETFEQVKGPFAFIIFDKATSKLYFARDTFGRRSLLIGKNETNFMLTSVATRHIGLPMIELPALGIYCLDLNAKEINELTLYPWKNVNQNFALKLEEIRKIISVNVSLNIEVTETHIKDLVCPDEFTILFDNLASRDLNLAFEILTEFQPWQSNLLDLEKYLETSMERRIQAVPRFCSECVSSRKRCNHCTIGILFSGGVDCSIIALLADKFIDRERQIDLMNVSFDQGGDNFETPDRLTARQTFKELQQLRPKRKWVLVEINVFKEGLLLLRSASISDLIFPLNTILDESLGCALWFAASGVAEDYTTTARVLLVGMGADELFGGYTRHRAAFKRGGWTALAAELENDWKNISHRNLARDDRVISDHGRQVRTPYLDEDFVEFVRSLQPWQKCYPSEKVPQGFGDKLLLRSLANHLGLKQAAIIRKRAIQFGTRIANKNENAHEKSPRL